MPPTQEFILKIEELCNLACDYCYMYELADQDWRTRPKRMSDGTLAQVAARLGQYAAHHHLPLVRVILHGGEPLMLGAAGIERVVETLRASMPDGCALEVRAQTNGALLTEDLAAALDTLGVRLGVSVDGPREAHDRHRRYADGRPSFDRVAQGLEVLRGHPDIYSGLLCVIDLDNDPLETYETLLGFAPPYIDFLLPLNNHANPPPRRKGPADYADWLYAAFDPWYSATVKPVGIRLFEELMHLILGGAARTSFLGPIAIGMPMVVESDGSIEMVDSLKSTYPGAARTGCDVARHDFDDAAFHQDSFMAAHTPLAQPCRRCPQRPVCGGGQLAHRWNGTGFDSASVYCADMKRLIRRIRRRMFEDPGADAAADRALRRG